MEILDRKYCSASFPRYLSRKASLMHIILVVARSKTICNVAKNFLGNCAWEHMLLVSMRRFSDTPWTLIFLRKSKTVLIFYHDKANIIRAKTQQFKILIIYSIKIILLDRWRDSFLGNFDTTKQYYYTSDSLWKRAFNQFTIVCELDMIKAISAADIAFIMSRSLSACLLSPLECCPQKQNGWTLLFLRMNYVKNV